MLKKIEFTAMPSGVSGKKKGWQVVLAACKLVNGQPERLQKLAEAEEPVKVTIVPVQGNLPLGE